VDQYGVIRFEDSFIEGFGFDEDFRLVWPPTYDYLIEDADDIATGRRFAIPIVTEALHTQDPNVHPLNPYQPDSMYIPMGQDLLETADAYFKPEAWWPLLDEQVREQNGDGKARQGAGEDAESKATAKS
jgi:hypothetical protein